jgi:hypothetical protein
MDRKTIVIVVICLAAWIGMNSVVNKFFPPPPPPAHGGTNAPATTQNLSLTNATTASNVVTTTLVEASTNAVNFIVETNTPEELLVVTNENARYTFTSHGGGIKVIEVIGVSTRKERASGRIPTLNSHAPAPTLAILDGEAVQGNGIFRLTQSGDSVRAEKQLPNGLTIVKQFQVSSNYLVKATVRLEN